MPILQVAHSPIEDIDVDCKLIWEEFSEEYNKVEITIEDDFLKIDIFNEKAQCLGSKKFTIDELINLVMKQ